MFQRILIANRGEIAVRVIRACRDLGIEAVAVYSEADAGARHVALADQAILLGPPSPAESYLRIDRVVRAALDTGCDAIHPGYGFLSERAAFARAVTEAGLTFIGPPAEAIEAMGSKTAARALMQEAGVPVVPGYQSGGSLDDYAAAAESLGYPVLVKAAGGGGGKGMRAVLHADDLVSAVEGAAREAGKAFGDTSVYVEKLLVNPRHIEVQVMADRHGNVAHLFERDCSVQRRHQKIIEETPAAHLSETVRQRMGQAAVAAAHAVGYVNAGTIEFLLDADGHFYFLEMNTRLQVEHPITELVVGFDLVKLQIAVAAGQPLPFRQADVRQRGHAVECRVYAEDPSSGFLPSTGPLLKVVEPGGPGVRVDSGFVTGDTVSHYYDPLLAKLITWGNDREAALATMRRALDEYAVLGVTTNLSFLRAVLDHPTFCAGHTTTAWVEQALGEWAEPTDAPDDALIAAALLDILTPTASAAPGAALTLDGDPYNPWRQATPGGSNGTTILHG